MAISVAVLVGDAQTWLPDLSQLAQKLKVNGGFEKETDLWVPLPSETIRRVYTMPSVDL